MWKRTRCENSLGNGAKDMCGSNLVCTSTTSFCFLRRALSFAVTEDEGLCELPTYCSSSRSRLAYEMCRADRSHDFGTRSQRGASRAAAGKYPPDSFNSSLLDIFERTVLRLIWNVKRRACSLDIHGHSRTSVEQQLTRPTWHLNFCIVA
jgi:hypothetical protein